MQFVCRLNFIYIFIFFYFFSFQSLQSDEKEKSKEKPQNYKAEITLCDGRTLTGIIELNIPEKFIINHEVNGLEFTKELEMEEIYSFLFIGWSPELVENKPNKGKIYKFYVSRFSIELKDSLELKVVKKIPEFIEKFSFKNKMGKVVLYTYWMDLLKPDNTWYTGLSGPENGERSFCYKDVVKKIVFKDNEKLKNK